MPHLPSINIRTTGIETLINYYKSTIVSKNTYLIIDNKIKWKNVRLLSKHYQLKNIIELNQNLLTEVSLDFKNIQKLINPFFTNVNKMMKNLSIQMNLNGKDDIIKNYLI